MGKGKDIVAATTASLVDFQGGLEQFLTSLGLPASNVLAGVDERKKVVVNLPDLLAKIEDKHKHNSLYLSKFVAACSAGLFDAALNFLWDEVINSIRGRVVAFDLPYFYDTAIPDAQMRQRFQSEQDLQALSDAMLISGALKCGFLTELGYKHLDYIRDMRNWASAAHPNHAQLTGLQLVSWLETCLQEVVLKDNPTPVIALGRLLHNLRTGTLRSQDVKQVEEGIKNLPEDLVGSLLRSVVGIYCDLKQPVSARDNIKLVARCIWNHAPDAARGEIGLRYSTYAANADTARKDLAHEFLSLVNGLAFLPEGDLAMLMIDAIRDLQSVHASWDNFHFEPRPAQALLKLTPDTGFIPRQVLGEYVSVVVKCRVGRHSGVSGAAVPFYDQMIARFDKAQIRAFIATLADPVVSSVLVTSSCASNFRSIAKRMLQKTVDLPTRKVLDAIIVATHLNTLWRDSKFEKLVADL